jgi:hypothetical protein
MEKTRGFGKEVGKHDLEGRGRDNTYVFRHKEDLRHDLDSWNTFSPSLSCWNFSLPGTQALLYTAQVIEGRI